MPDLPRPLAPEALRAACDPAAFAFASTADLPALDGLVGQDRALEATAFGVGMRDDGYNLFVLGPPASGKTTVMRRILADAARTQPTPSDWCYVHDFHDPHRPLALALPAGQGRALREAMARLVVDCRARLPRALESEGFQRRKSALVEEFGRKQQTALEELEAVAHAKDFAVLRTPNGFAIVPAPHGAPMGPEEFAALPQAERDAFDARAAGVRERGEATLRTLRELERTARDAHDALVHDVAADAVRPLVDELRERFVAAPDVGPYLEAVETDLVAHAEEFGLLEAGAPPMPFAPHPGAFLERYRVNVLVDRTGATGAPVVFEPSPTHGNLIGRVEYRPQFGTLVTDFTLIQAGALHRANGGYLVVEAKDLLRTFLAWDAVKGALKTRTIRIESPLDELRVAATTTLAPQPIPLAVKVVLLGSPLLYYLLHALDDDFRELFKVKVDFDDSMPRTPAYEIAYARFAGEVCRELDLPPLSAGGVARLVEQGSREVAHRERLSTRLGVLRDLVREAAFYAARGQHATIDAADVDAAIEARTRRGNLLQERLARAIAEDTVLIATDGAVVGQVNGIAVLAVGDHAFGRPSRITARTFVGEPGVVDIEREAKLGGRLHSKGVLILSGFLAGRYARTTPLAVSASLAFEQQYDEVDGDSASSAELYALLSSIADVPLRQDLAVTGSVNQRGEVQAVGGINEKVEGFFDVCAQRGLTGRQGVLVPAANVRHLMLRRDVVDAVRSGRFAVYPIATVDEGLALLTGRPAGEPDADGRFPDGSVNAAVAAALARNLEALKQLGPRER